MSTKHVLIKITSIPEIAALKPFFKAVQHKTGTFYDVFMSKFSVSSRDFWQLKIRLTVRP